MRPGILITVAFLLTACGDSSLPSIALQGTAMGTTFNITIIDPPQDAPLEKIDSEIHRLLEDVENLASTYRDHSELSLLNANSETGWVSISSELCSLLSQALEVSEESNGAFDFTVGPLVNRWGFGPQQQLLIPPGDADLQAAMARVGFQHVDIDCVAAAVQRAVAGMYIDLSGWAKGFAVDRLASLLDDHNINNYLVELGGELRARGKNADSELFAIAIEKPSLDHGLQYSVLRISNAAVATSGDYRNFFEHEGKRYSHTIDPRTGRPIKHSLTGVTVVSESAAYADAMATALLVLGPDAGMALAEKLNLAALFLVRSTEELVETPSTAFRGLQT